MKTYFADQRVLFRLQAMLLFPCAFLLFLLTLLLPRFDTGFWIAVLLFSGLYALIAFFWLPRFFSGLRIHLSQIELSLCSGVFTKMQRTMRIDAIQYCAQIRTSRFPLLTVQCVIAHAPGARIVLPFLSKRDAEEISAALNAQLTQRRAVHE